MQKENKLYVQYLFVPIKKSSIPTGEEYRRKYMIKIRLSGYFVFTLNYLIVLQILDKLLLYLRMVHSVDYYNGSQYVHEDEMPNRCGIIHLRVQQPSSEVFIVLIDYG